MLYRAGGTDTVSWDRDNLISLIYGVDGSSFHVSESVNISIYGS